MIIDAAHMIVVAEAATEATPDLTRTNTRRHPHDIRIPIDGIERASPDRQRLPSES